MNQFNTTIQTLQLDAEQYAQIDSPAFDWGKEDGLAGTGRRGSVYFCFDTPDYAAYDEGHAEGTAQRNQLTGKPSPAFCQGYQAARSSGEYVDGQCSEYRHGYSAGRIINRRLGNLPMPAPVAGRLRSRVLSEVKRLAGGSEYAPFSDPALLDVQSAEMREDWIGE
mgnify:CR=1 FL=1